MEYFFVAFFGLVMVLLVGFALADRRASTDVARNDSDDDVLNLGSSFSDETREIAIPRDNWTLTHDLVDLKDD